MIVISIENARTDNGSEECQNCSTCTFMGWVDTSDGLFYCEDCWTDYGVSVKMLSCSICTKSKPRNTLNSFHLSFLLIFRIWIQQVAAIEIRQTSKMQTMPIASSFCEGKQKGQAHPTDSPWHPRFQLYSWESIKFNFYL